MNIIHLKGQPIITKHSLDQFLQICSTDLYDQFYKACFNHECYSQNEIETFFINNYQHFNNLLQNELKRT